MAEENAVLEELADLLRRRGYTVRPPDGTNVQVSVLDLSERATGILAALYGGERDDPQFSVLTDKPFQELTVRELAHDITSHHSLFRNVPEINTSVIQEILEKLAKKGAL